MCEKTIIKQYMKKLPYRKEIVTVDYSLLIKSVLWRSDNSSK